MREPPRTTPEKLIRYWLPPALWAAVIFAFSSIPQTKTTQIYWQDFAIKKTAHVVEYAILTTLLYRGFKGVGYSKKDAAISAFIISAFYGATDEYHQGFTPGREPHVRDVVFDTIGAGLAVYTLWKLLPKAPRKLQKLAKDYQLT